MGAPTMLRCLLQLVFSYVTRAELVCCVQVCDEWRAAAYTAPCLKWTVSGEKSFLRASRSPLVRQHASNICPWVSVEHLPILQTWDNLRSLMLRVDRAAGKCPSVLPRRLVDIFIIFDGAGLTQLDSIMRALPKVARLTSVDLSVSGPAAAAADQIDLAPLDELLCLSRLEVTSTIPHSKPLTDAQVAALIKISPRLETLVLDNATSFTQLLRAGARFPCLEFLALYSVRGHEIAPLVDVAAADAGANIPRLSFTSLSFRGQVSAAQLSLFSRLHRVTKCKLYGDDNDAEVDFRGLATWTHMTNLNIFTSNVASIALPPRLERMDLLECHVTCGLEWLSTCASPLLLHSVGLRSVSGLQENDLTHLQGLRNLQSLCLPQQLHISPLLRAFLHPPACHGMFPELKTLGFM